MHIVTPAQMEEIDRRTIHDYGLSSLVLMENAARSVLHHLPPGTTTVLVGPGNNGGDGLVLARALHEQGRQVKAVLLSDQFSNDASTNLQLARKWGVDCATYSDGELNNCLAQSEVLVDALFGTGLSRPLEGQWREAVEQTNASNCHVVAIDIPSGVHGGTGQILGQAVRAHQTVTFGLPKRGHYLYPGRTHTGTLQIVQPGFHPATLKLFPQVNYLNEQLAAALLPRNWPTMHKGDNGRLLMVTGSLSFPGAGLLGTLGALKAGAGLVSHNIPDELFPLLTQWTPEAMPRSRFEPVDFKDFNAAVLGSGLGPEATLIEEVLANSELPMVVDADALRQVLQIPRERRQNFVLTPHPGELARLLDRSVGELEKDRIQTALEAAEQLGCVLCFKGAPTIIASPQGHCHVNSTGNSVLAQGGTGDLLAGIIGAYLAYGLPLLDAAAAGVFIHGLSADLARERYGPRGVGAHTLAELVPFAYARVVGNM